MPGIEIADNTMTFSQSWLNTFMNCPEQARLEMLGLLPRKETDATAIGSAMHAGIEAVLGGASLTGGEGVAIETFDELIAQDCFEWVQIKTRGTAEKTLQRVYWTWANEVWPELAGVQAIEHKFDVPITTVDGTLVRIRGAIDLIDELGTVWDWKTANTFRMWNEWEIPKKLQPTVYTYAMACADEDFERPREFVYAVMNKAAQEHQLFFTTRCQADWNWLAEQIEAAVYMIKADLPAWGKVDSSALCSPKWCTAWSSCKGKHL